MDFYKFYSVVLPPIIELSQTHNRFIANLPDGPNFAMHNDETTEMTKLSRRLFLVGSLLNGGISAQLTPVLAHSKHGSQTERVRETLAASELISAARNQIGVTTRYDGSYRSLDYPGGDIDLATGVCVDVLIRAYRTAFDIDLQRLIHEDMSRAFNAYPKLWRLTRPDRNIDHRRVPNIETWLARQGTELPPENWMPGDIIAMRLPGNLPHIAIVSDRKNQAGEWLVIHNIGRGVQEESIIGIYQNERRFRFLITSS